MTPHLPKLMDWTTRTKLAALLASLAVLLIGAAVVRAATGTGPDFTLAAQPPSQTVISGGSTSYVISLTPSNGFSGNVALTAGSLPKGMSASWSSSTVAIPAGSRGVTTTLTIGGGQPTAGTYSPAVTATNGSTSHTVLLTLAVVGQNAPTFSLSASPSAQTLVQGASASSTITINRSNWSGTVSFGVSTGLPTGTTATATPSSTAGSSSSLLVTAGASTPAGLYTVVVPATGVLSGQSASTRYAFFTLLIKNATGATAVAPGADATTAAIPASALGSTLSGATGDASGTVTFKVFGPQATAPTSCAAGGTTVGTATVNGPGSYHPSAGYTPTSAGSYWWYASYGGDTYNNAASSTCGNGMAQTVVRNTTTSSVTAPASAAATATIPAASITSALAGATASPAAGGTITYYVYGPSSSAPSTCPGGTNWTTVGTSTVTGNGNYHPAAGFTPAVGGTYWWYATYGGDTVNSASSSSCNTSSMTSTMVQDFSISASPSSQNALTGGTADDAATYSISITQLGGFSGSAALTVSSGLPTGATSSFSPASTSEASTLTIDVGTQVEPGTYTLKVQGAATISGTPVTRSTQVTLVIGSSTRFTISGDVPNPLYPGAAAQIFPVTLANPNSFAITVSSAGVTVQPQNAPGCDPSWFKVTMPTVPASGLTISAKSSVTLNGSAQMIDSGTKQDACEGKQLKLAYNGSYGK